MRLRDEEVGLLEGIVHDAFDGFDEGYALSAGGDAETGAERP